MLGPRRTPNSGEQKKKHSLTGRQGITEHVRKILGRISIKRREHLGFRAERRYTFLRNWLEPLMFRAGSNSDLNNILIF